MKTLKKKMNVDNVKWFLNDGVPFILNDALFAVLGGEKERGAFVGELAKFRSDISRMEGITPKAFLEAYENGIRFPGIFWGGGMLILPPVVRFLLPDDFPIENASGETLRAGEVPLTNYRNGVYEWYGIVPLKYEQNRAVESLEKFISQDVVKKNWGELYVDVSFEGKKKVFRIRKVDVANSLVEITTEGSFSMPCWDEGDELEVPFELQGALLNACKTVREIFKSSSEG